MRQECLFAIDHQQVHESLGCNSDSETHKTKHFHVLHNKKVNGWDQWPN